LNGDDAVIFEEAWDHFGSSPPEKLKIIVADAPGEKEKRKTTQLLEMRSNQADTVR